MWYRQERWRNRLLAEQELMRSRFPGFSLIEPNEGDLRWLGIITPVRRRHFLVSIRYPANYPYAHPRLFVEEPALHGNAPHRYGNDGSLCIHKDHWDPATGTAVSCVPLAAAWLTAYLAWRAGGGSY